MTSLTEKETEFYQLYQKEAEKCHTPTTQMEMLKQQLSGITGLTNLLCIAAIKFYIPQLFCISHKTHFVLNGWVPLF